MATKNASVVLRPEQVWADDQRGQEGRTVKIVEVCDETVRIETLTATDTSKQWNLGAASIGRIGKVAIHNLRRNYSLVSEAPTAGPQGHAEPPTAERLLEGLSEAMQARGGELSVIYAGKAKLWIAAWARHTGDDSPTTGSAPTLAGALHDLATMTGWVII